MDTYGSLLDAAPVFELVAEVGSIHEQRLKRARVHFVAFDVIHRDSSILVQVPPNQMLNSRGQYYQ
jgi:hypothetical protein